MELDRLTAPAGAGPSPDAEPGARASAPPVFAAAIRALPRIRGGRAAIDEVRALVAPLGCEDGLDDFARTYDLLERGGLGRRASSWTSRS